MPIAPSCKRRITQEPVFAEILVEYLGASLSTRQVRNISLQTLT